MANDWILDVLADLRTFASLNGMPRLAEHLDDATLAAGAEISAAGLLGNDAGGDGQTVVTARAQAHGEGSEPIAGLPGVRRNA